MYKLAVADGEKTNTPFDFIPPTDNISGVAKPDDIISLFGLDQWQAEKIPNHNEESDKVANSYHVRRSDDKKILTPYVKDAYDVYQYSDGAKWLTPFIEEGMLSIDSCLMLNDGLEFSILSNIGMEATVTGEDRVERYLLMKLSHDGKRRGFYFTDIRPVCQNTLYMAMGQGLAKASKNFELGNTNPESRMKAAKKLIDLAERKFHEERLYEYKAYERLELEEDQVDRIFRSILNLPLGNEVVKELTDKQQERYLSLKESYQNSAGMELLDLRRHTGWRILNAVTNFQQNGKTATDKFLNSTFAGQSIRKNTETLLQDHLPKSFIPV